MTGQVDPDKCVGHACAVACLCCVGVPSVRGAALTRVATSPTCRCTHRRSPKELLEYIFRRLVDFKKFDQGNDEYINLDKLRLVCRELGETLGSGSEQSDEQLKDMLRYAKNDDGGGSGGQLQVTKQELWDCLSKTRLMKS